MHAPPGAINPGLLKQGDGLSLVSGLKSSAARAGAIPWRFPLETLYWNLTWKTLRPGASTMSDLSNTQQRVQDLSAGWRDHVAEALGLDPRAFRFAQGSLGLQTSDSSGLWRLADAVPSESATQYYDAGGLSRWSSAYGNLLFAISPETGSDLREVLGDMYSAWNEYALKNGRGRKAFKEWADDNLDPMHVANALAVYQKALNTPWSRASDAYLDPANQQEFTSSDQKQYSLYRYSPDLENAQRAINVGERTGISFDSKSVERTQRESAVEGSASGMWDIFSGSAGGGLETLNAKAATARITVEGTIGQYATLAVQPGAWFSPEELERAFHARDDFGVWDANANSGRWESFFGPDGSMARRVTQLVLVSDYKITVTSHAEYDQDDEKKITAKASVGVWPFFSGEVSGSYETACQINKESHLEMTHTLDKGKIQIWGVTVHGLGG